MSSRESRERLGVTALVSVVAACAFAASALALGGEPQAADSNPANGTPGGEVVVAEPRFSLSLPDGWTPSDTPRGSEFMAASSDGLAETTLWVERAPGQPFEEFVEQSAKSLDQLGTDVKINDRDRGLALVSRATQLRAKVPLDGGLEARYRVTLRAAGPYRYYLATSVQPTAPAHLRADAGVLSSSLRPAIRLGDADETLSE